MESAPERLHRGFIAAGYAAVALVAAILLYNQHLQRIRDLNIMNATGVPPFHPYSDWLLALLIGGLFLIPTFVLISNIRESETAYTVYAQILLVISVSFPICMLFVPLIPLLGSDFLSGLCLYRFYVSPAVIVGLGASRFAAQFSRAKRLISYALGIEMGVFVAGLVFLAFVLRGLSTFH